MTWLGNCWRKRGRTALYCKREFRQCIGTHQKVEVSHLICIWKVDVERVEEIAALDMKAIAYECVVWRELEEHWTIEH